MSELRENVSLALFKKAYMTFIEQADKNAISGDANGSKAPYGFSKIPTFDGATFKSQYGQGAASSTPYMNWWAASIYYLPSNGKIVLGIEDGRYPHISEINIEPLGYEQIGRKKQKIAVFYSSIKEEMDYEALYLRFMDLCEEIMRLGLE